jgi:hypothetical protein
MAQGKGTHGPATTDGVSAAAGRLLASVQRAVEATVLYSGGHPAVRDAVREAASGREGLFHGHDSVTILPLR